MFQDLQNLFLKQHGKFAKDLQFRTIIIFLVVVIFLTTYFEKNYGFIIILVIFALYIANTFTSITNDSINDFNKEIMYKLRTLQQKMYDHIDYKQKMLNNTGQKISKSEIDKMYKRAELDSMYIDSDLIVFLYSIVKLYDYNPFLYVEILKGTNNILKIRREIEEFYNANGIYPENTSEMLQIALDLKSNTINNLHDFIYNVPKIPKMYDYVNDCIERYAILISRNTDSIHEYYKKNIDDRGINATTNFITYNTTKHFDLHNNYPILPGKIYTNPIKFYT